MESGYKVVWTKHALAELGQTLKFVEKKRTAKELKRLAVELERITQLLQSNPLLFQKAQHEIRRVVVVKYNTLYYRIAGNEVQVLSFFSNRQNPDRLALD